MPGEDVHICMLTLVLPCSCSNPATHLPTGDLPPPKATTLSAGRAASSARSQRRDMGSPEPAPRLPLYCTRVKTHGILITHDQ